MNHKKLMKNKGFMNTRGQLSGALEELPGWVIVLIFLIVMFLILAFFFGPRILSGFAHLGDILLR